jgi:lysophospholipase L1-like esterase
MVVVALGANDSQSQNAQQDYSALVSRLKRLAPKLLAVEVASRSAAQVNAAIKAALQDQGIGLVEMHISEGIAADGIHLEATGYRQWVPELVASVSRSLGCMTAHN